MNYYLPSYFIMKEDNMYYPIVKKSENKINFLGYDELKEQSIFEN